MRRASSVFDDESRQRVNAAIGAAEAQTSAEIVPVIAASSGRYDRAEDLAGLWLAVVAITFAWILFQRVDANEGGWTGPNLTLGLAPLLVILLAAFVVGVVLASHVGWLRRLFTTRREMQAEVQNRAAQAFYDHRVHHTASDGGLLIYISLYERMAAVIGDQTVVERLGAPAIDELCTQLTAALRKDSLPEALIRTIKSAADRLAPVMPRSAGDANELPDALVTVD